MANYNRERKADLLKLARRRGLVGRDDDPTKQELVGLLERANQEDHVSEQERERPGQGSQDQGGQEETRTAGQGQGAQVAGSQADQDRGGSARGAVRGQGELGAGDTVEPLGDTQGSREGPEAEFAEVDVQPSEPPRAVASGGQWAGPPGSGDAAAAVRAKQSAVGGEGMVSPEEGLAAAEAGNRQVADNFQPEQEAGYRGLNPAAHQNVEHTVAGHLAFAQLSKEEQDARRREIHEANLRNLRGDDWS